MASKCYKGVLQCYRINALQWKLYFIKTLHEAFSLMTLHIKGLFLWNSAHATLWLKDTLRNYAMSLWSVIMPNVVVHFSFFYFTFNYYSASFQKKPNGIKVLQRRTLTLSHQCITVKVIFYEKTLHEAFSIMTLHKKGLFLWHSAYAALWLKDTLHYYAMSLRSVIMPSVVVHFSFFLLLINIQHLFGAVSTHQQPFHRQPNSSTVSTQQQCYSVPTHRHQTHWQTKLIDSF